MANCQFDLRPANGADSSLSPVPSSETAFLSSWDNDIKRAARAAAKGDRAYAEDLAQQARARLMAVNRVMEAAPPPYIRTVIANTLRTARRRESLAFTTRSPLAEELNEDLEASVDQQVEGKEVPVATWVERLPAPLQEIYRRLYVEERSQRETAKLMGVSQPRVAQLHRKLLELGRQAFVRLTT